MCQKVFNALAVASFLMSGTVIAGVGYVAMNKEEIKSRLISQTLEEVKTLLPSLTSGSATGIISESGTEPEVFGPAIPF
mgnify:CR=1 FL=1